MVRVSVMHDALKTMYNAEKKGKKQVLVRPSSKVVVKFLQVMMKNGELMNAPPSLQICTRSSSHHHAASSRSLIKKGWSTKARRMSSAVI